MFSFPFNVSSPLFYDLWRLQQEADELLGDWGSSSGIRSLPRGSFPALNIVQTSTRVDIYVFAPGIDPKTFDASIQQNLLTVSGKRELDVNENADYYRQERFSGEFRRVISLPEDVDPDAVEAQYANGILQVTVQRREENRPRQIAIH
ncbi:MAG TPA: Hsp20/alpha crystallin family protein [Rhodanobacteraceae bacterium]|jgi:HSP20 family protein